MIMIMIMIMIMMIIMRKVQDCASCVALEGGNKKREKLLAIFYLCLK